MPAPTTANWENELGTLLTELSQVQEELLAVLAAKRDYLENADLAGLAELQSREVQLGTRLKACHDQRLELLTRARQQELPGDSLSRLTSILPARQREKLGKQVKESQAKTRILQAQSITNWVLAQRSLLHVSQLLEIIATGGRMQPTYGEGESAFALGSLVNDEA